MAAKRNGKIELLRFVFCISVLLYHINNDLWGGEKILFGDFSFFAHGRTGVEFFFLVSGYLTAKSAYKLSLKKTPIAKSTFDFMVKKISSVFTAHIIVVVMMIVYLLSVNKLTATKFLNKLPSVFFLQCTGISDDYFIAVEWYLCAMFFALVIVYPMLLKNFRFVSQVVSPVASVLLIGYLISNYNQLPSSRELNPFIAPCNLRGLAVVLLGVFSYAVSEKIKSTDFTKTQKFLLAIAENICWLASIAFIVSAVSKKYEGTVVIIMAAAVMLTFSRNFDGSIYDNRIVYYLGKISLPVYLCQNVVRKIIKEQIDLTDKKMIVLLIVVLTVFVGILIDFICDFIKKRKILKFVNNS